MTGADPFDAHTGSGDGAGAAPRDHTGGPGGPPRIPLPRASVEDGGRPLPAPRTCRRSLSSCRTTS